MYLPPKVTLQEMDIKKTFLSKSTWSHNRKGQERSFHHLYNSLIEFFSNLFGPNCAQCNAEVPLIQGHQGNVYTDRHVTDTVIRQPIM